MSFIRRGVPFCVLMTVFSMSRMSVTRPTARTLICCEPCSMKLPPALAVGVGELLLNLCQAQTIGDQFVWVQAYLVFASDTAER